MKCLGIFFGIILLFPIGTTFAESEIPEWVKNNAGWWAEGLIGDSDFVSGIQFLIEKGIMIIPETKPVSQSSKGIPEWVKNNARWWAEGQIDDGTFVQGIQFLITIGLISIEKTDIISSDIETKSKYSDFHIIPKSGQRILVPVESLFDVYGFVEDFEIRDGRLWVTNGELRLNPDNMDVYKEIGVWNDEQKTVVVYPIFTAMAYGELGFYDYYKGNCDESCLTVELKSETPLDYNDSGTGFQTLNLLGYKMISDVHVDRNPEILKQFDKVILLHNEYVTKNEFEAITNHSKVIYLYPNALYAEINVDYENRTISLVRGHGYPEENINNGFDWEFDNTHPYEYDNKCENWLFSEIDNGIMLNCYPDYVIHSNKELLQKIKEY